MKKTSIAASVVFSVAVAVIVFITGYAVLCPTIYANEALIASANLNTYSDGRIIYGFSRYIAVCLISAVGFGLAFAAERFWCVCSRMGAAIKKDCVSLLVHIIAFCSSVILGLISELFYRLVINPNPLERGFNTASFAGFCAVYTFVAILITEKKRFASHPEKAVALMIFTLGTFIILAQPFAHCGWDIDSHYPWALQNSFVGKAYYSEADIWIYESGIGRFLLGKADTNSIVLTMNNLPQTAIMEVPVSFSLAHLPSGIAIALGRFFGLNFHLRYWLGELANLLIYTTTCYFAIKKLKSGKMIMSVLAMLPTTIFIASNYSYDAWVTGFSFLGIAYFLNMVEQPDKPIKTSDTIIMSLSFMLAAIPKLVYAVLFLIPLFMRKSNWDKKEKKRYYFWIFAFLILTFVLFAIKSSSSIGGSGDTRGGDVNPSEQVAYIFGNPFEYTKILLNFLAGYLSPMAASEYITNLAYLGVSGGAFVYLILMAFCTVTDKRDCNRFKGMNSLKIIILVIQFAALCLVATSMYVVFTPVAHPTINGCQHRYLIPLLAPILLTIANPGIKLAKSKNAQAIYNGLVFTTLSVTGLFVVFNLVALPMF